MIWKITKKSAILILLLLMAALIACSSVISQRITEPPSPAESGEESHTIEPERTPEPKETPALEESLYPGILYSVEQEPIAVVRAYHVADDAYNQPELVEYKLIDLSSLDGYHELEDSYQELLGSQEVSCRIIFIADLPVKDFRYLSIETTLFEDGMGIELGDVLYQLDTLNPEEPFVVNWTSIGDTGMFRGISFEDKDGVTRYLGFNISGYDGDLYFIEFTPGA